MAIFFVFGQPLWGCDVSRSFIPPDKSGGYAQFTPTEYAFPDNLYILIEKGAIR